MIVDSDRTFPRESPVCAYWLTRCEGFTVRSESRVLGVVESVDLNGFWIQYEVGAKDAKKKVDAFLPWTSVRWLRLLEQK